MIKRALVVYGNLYIDVIDTEKIYVQGGSIIKTSKEMIQGFLKDFNSCDVKIAYNNVRYTNLIIENNVQLFIYATGSINMGEVVAARMRSVNLQEEHIEQYTAFYALSYNVINAPINLSEPYQVIGLGQYNGFWDTVYVANSIKVNILSKHKPVESNNPAMDIGVGNNYRGESGRLGMLPIYTGLPASGEINSGLIDTITHVWQKNTLLPWGRLTDFEGYCHSDDYTSIAGHRHLISVDGFDPKFQITLEDVVVPPKIALSCYQGTNDALLSIKDILGEYYDAAYLTCVVYNKTKNIIHNYKDSVLLKNRPETFAFYPNISSDHRWIDFNDEVLIAVCITSTNRVYSIKAYNVSGYEVKKEYTSEVYRALDLPGLYVDYTESSQVRTLEMDSVRELVFNFYNNSDVAISSPAKVKIVVQSTAIVTQLSYYNTQIIELNNQGTIQPYDFRYQTAKVSTAGFGIYFANTTLQNPRSWTMFIYTVDSNNNEDKLIGVYNRDDYRGELYPSLNHATFLNDDSLTYRKSLQYSNNTWYWQFTVLPNTTHENYKVWFKLNDQKTGEDFLQWQETITVTKGKTQTFGGSFTQTEHYMNPATAVINVQVQV